VSISIAALAGVRHSEAGLASGLINTSQQVGGALGVAVLATVANSRTDAATADGSVLPVALTNGFGAAFIVGAAIAFAGVLVGLFVVRREDLAQPEAEEELVLEPALGLDEAA
jgi:sugar phosphate permease